MRKIDDNLEYSFHSRLLVPCLALDAPLVALEASSERFLLAVTEDGGVAVWDVLSLKRTVRSSVRALFGASSAAQCYLANASVGDDGQPLVTLPNCESFVFHAALESWLRVVDRRHLRSEHTSVLPVKIASDADKAAVERASGLESSSNATTAGVTVAQLREQVCHFFFRLCPCFYHKIFYHVLSYFRSFLCICLTTFCLLSYLLSWH